MFCDRVQRPRVGDVRGCYGKQYDRRRANVCRMTPIVEGQKFERLVVVAAAEKRGAFRYWLVRCICTKEKEVREYDLVKGNVRSCGCLRNELAAKRGKLRPPPPTRGEANPNWLQAPSYNTMHVRLKCQLGPASRHSCSGCPAQAAEWAYDGADPNELIDAHNGFKYSVDVGRYRPLCKRCRRQEDAERRSACFGERDIWKARAIAMGWTEDHGDSVHE